MKHDRKSNENQKLQDVRTEPEMEDDYVRRKRSDSDLAERSHQREYRNSCDTVSVRLVTCDLNALPCALCSMPYAIRPTTVH